MQEGLQGYIQYRGSRIFLVRTQYLFAEDDCWVEGGTERLLAEEAAKKR
jgi:hypothetical protein